MTAREIADAILRGDVDVNLDKIFEALRDRRKELFAQRGARVRAMLKIGDRVRFTADGPGYLEGVGGVIRGMSKTGARFLVDVDMDPRAGRRSGTRALPCHPATLDRAENTSPPTQHMQDPPLDLPAELAEALRSGTFYKFFRVVPPAGKEADE